MNQPGAPVIASKSRVHSYLLHGKLGGTTGVISRPFEDGRFLFSRVIQLGSTELCKISFKGAKPW